MAPLRADRSRGDSRRIEAHTRRLHAGWRRRVGALVERDIHDDVAHREESLRRQGLGEEVGDVVHRGHEGNVVFSVSEVRFENLKAATMSADQTDYRTC